jgi:predicted nucleic acid-binding protein
LLLEILQQSRFDLFVPDTVDDEVLRREKGDPAFAGTGSNWNLLTAHGHVNILSSDPDSADGKALANIVYHLTRRPLAERLEMSKDLGELMVIAHAKMRSDRGEKVVVIIDEWRGQQLASQVGLKVINTERILLLGIKTGHITDKNHMKKLYNQLREFDLGLVVIEETKLLSTEVWKDSETQDSQLEIADEEIATTPRPLPYAPRDASAMHRMARASGI